MESKEINKLTKEEKETIISISKRIGNDSDGNILRFFVNEQYKEVNIINTEPRIKKYAEEVNDIASWIKTNPNLFSNSNSFLTTLDTTKSIIKSDKYYNHCLWCGRGFESELSNGAFCSEDHYNKWTSNSNANKLKISINNMYGIKSSNKINSKVNEPINNKKFKLPCIWCGKPFFSDNLNQAACSMDHYTKWLDSCSETKETINNYKSKEYPINTFFFKECVVCGKRFKTTDKNDDCCSFEHFLIKDKTEVQEHGLINQSVNTNSKSNAVNKKTLEKNDISKSKIKDSGNRRQFETGAVRDMAEGKGRCDLLPACALIRLSKHYENGAKKYVERNWEKGIPLSVMIDSGIRHLLKYLDGMDDEDHLTAAAWNILGAMWMEEKHPELQDIPSRKSHK